MPNYSSNREILIRTSESGSFSFESSSLSNTKPIICKYIETLPNKLIDSTFTKNVSYITHNTVNMNLDYIFDYVSKLPFTVIYNIYDNIDILQNLAFDNCNTLKSIILPEGLTNIGKFAFNGCNNLKTIILPMSVKEIEEQAFNGCEKLSKIDVSNITDIHQYSFAGSGIKSIELHQSIFELPPYLFKNCSKLKIFDNSNILSLGEGVFSGCLNLESVVINNFNSIKEADEEEFIETEKIIEPEEPEEPDQPTVTYTYHLIDPSGYSLRSYSSSVEEEYNEVLRLIDAKAVTQQKESEESTEINLILKSGYVTYHIYSYDKTTELFTTTDISGLLEEGLDEITSDIIYYKANENYFKFIKNIYNDKYDFKHAIMYKIKHEVYDEDGNFVYYIYPNYANLRVQLTLEDETKDKFYQMLDINGDPIYGKYIDKNLKIELVDHFRFSSQGYPEYHYKNALTGAEGWYKVGDEIPEGYEIVKKNGYPVYSDYFSKFGHTFEIDGSEYTFERLDKEFATELLGKYTFEADILLYPLNLSGETVTGLTLSENDLRDDLTYYTQLDGEESGGDDDDDNDDDTNIKEEDKETDIDNVGFDTIPDMLFANCRKLTHDSISFIDNITKIGKGSFMGCRKLDHIDKMPLEIKEFGFKDCINLRSIKLQNCPIIKDYAFKNCLSLTKVNLNKLEEETNLSIFEDCESLRSVVGNPSITTIGPKSFKNCKSLSYFENLGKISRIESQGFYGCESLVVSNDNNFNGLEYIGEYGLCKCKALNNITLQDGIVIGQGAFKDCKGLTHIELPVNIHKLDNQVFNNCSSLQTVQFNSPTLDSNFNMDAFDNCTSIREIIINPANTNFISINNQCVYNRSTNTIMWVTKNIYAFEFTQDIENSIIDPHAFDNSKVVLIDMSGINAPEITSNVFSGIISSNWFVFMKETDPKYKEYRKILGDTRVKTYK